jgi:hypothetical protein
MSTATKRPYIEVDTGLPWSHNCDTRDPIGLFAHMLAEQNRGTTKEVEESNRMLLESLFKMGHITKSSILWHGNMVWRIYGFRLGNGGKIEYCSPSRTSPKKTARAYVADIPDVDVSALKEAIMRSKQMAI